MEYVTKKIIKGIPTFMQYMGTRHIKSFTTVKDPGTIPFYVENASNSNETLSIAKNDSNAPTISIEKSTDMVTWSSLGSTSTTAITYTLAPGEKLYLRASTNTWASKYKYNIIYNIIDGMSKVGGNIMSLLYGSNFTGNETTINGDYALSCLFKDNTLLNDAGELILPATTLANSCYYSMFYGCTSLTTAPALPATTLADSCYYDMFHGCSSLTTAPALPATTLAQNCYAYMFHGCSSLTTAPTLPATTLVTYCYCGMFEGCSSLTTAPALPVTALAYGCYCRMFCGCEALTAAPALPATTLTNYCYYYMFEGCRALTTAPTLPATTLAQNCYHRMFAYCSSLNYIKCLATDISALLCTTDWVLYVAASGTFVKKAGASWSRNSDGIPSGWTVEDANI